MSGIQHVPTRRSPPHVRKSSGLQAPRSISSSKIPSAGPKITIGGAKKARKDKKEEGSASAEDDDIMAMSFLQYCAMCEKQIIVPNTSILYCSESCRRRDSIPSLTPINSYFTPPFHKANHADNTMRNHHSASLSDPLPRLQPTAASGSKEAWIPPKFHEGASDLDPTEWKPAEPAAGSEVALLKTGTSTPVLSSGHASPSGGSSTSLSNSWKPKLHHRPSSAASTYLSQFHRSSDSLSNVKRRSARATNSFPAHVTPDLSNSPTVSSTGSEESLSGTPYEVVMRPRAVSRPTTAVTTSPTEVSNVGMSYEKQNFTTVIDSNLRSASGSLKELLTGVKKIEASM